MIKLGYGIGIHPRWVQWGKKGWFKDDTLQKWANEWIPQPPAVGRPRKDTICAVCGWYEKGVSYKRRNPTEFEKARKFATYIVQAAGGFQRTIKVCYDRHPEETLKLLRETKLDLLRQANRAGYLTRSYGFLRGRPRSKRVRIPGINLELRKATQISKKTKHFSFATSYSEALQKAIEKAKAEELNFGK